MSNFLMLPQAEQASELHSCHKMMDNAGHFNRKYNFMEKPISKSQNKRDAAHLQALGISLIDLSENALEQLPLTDPLREAILQAKKLASFGAKRRQAQLIGKLMRSADSEAIIAAYQAMADERSGLTAHFHELEQWRERFIQQDNEALTDFIKAYPEVDIQKLRQLIKKAVLEEHSDTKTGAHKALFRFLKAETS